ncbi:xyloglucan endotransglucosylase/hydrolase protein 2-like [Impatiens glandulifera]|uniref:xyloglucan endotransglucosylase/hydrolase protein 2-like n=1 Tax=Impatiens glandulifera TaxID=253017 RepID=UPI001FB13915|nr:xyloglucan endotransglucosylase/hydrolase protein 2-like [Impatiens glandulifera]
MLLLMSTVTILLWKKGFATKEEEGFIFYSPSYDVNYKLDFGAKNVFISRQGTDVLISLDSSNGSGIISKLSYYSGFFHLNIKLSPKDTAGVVTTFYMTSNEGDELDFEFLGNKEGKPIFLQTNIILNGTAGREERIRLWFDPTSSFHTYRILWNSHQIVFYVDSIPIRVLKNLNDGQVRQPTRAMKIKGNIWNGDSWATDGGMTKINWTHSPFEAKLRSFGIDGCSSASFSQWSCKATRLWWNRERYWKLSSDEEISYWNVRNQFMEYDYCTDKSRYLTPPPECFDSN